MAQVFISYRHVDPDQELADELAAHLSAIRIPYFIDKEIRISVKWSPAIDHALSECESLVVFISAESIRSDMVVHEVQLAHRGRKRIFPVRVDYEGALPYDLGSYLDPIQYKLWRKGDPFASICKAIVDEIKTGEVPVTDEAFGPSREALQRLGELTERSGAPLPSADPRIETGGLQLDSPFYVHRKDDVRVERLAVQSGETILIKGPRQVGKTSLAARARAAAERSGNESCYIDFQLIDESRLLNVGTLFRYMAARLAKDFQTALKPQDLWDDMLGDADSLTDFIERAVLAEAGPGSPVLLCLDEVDNIFKQSYRDSFFGTVRGWHNRRATHPLWNRFNLVIVHSTEPALFIQDLNQSPFNVGTPIRLGDFDRDEILWLNTRQGSPIQNTQDLDMVVTLIGGHPYLVRQALYAMANNKISAAQLQEISGDDRGPFGDHLRRHLWVLRQNARLCKALKQVIAGRGCSDEDDFQRLSAAGLVKGPTRQSASIRCKLYADYMRDRL